MIVITIDFEPRKQRSPLPTAEELEDYVRSLGVFVDGLLEQAPAVLERISELAADMEPSPDQEDEELAHLWALLGETGLVLLEDGVADLNDEELAVLVAHTRPPYSRDVGLEPLSAEAVSHAWGVVQREAARRWAELVLANPAAPPALPPFLAAHRHPRSMVDVVDAEH